MLPSSGETQMSPGLLEAPLLLGAEGAVPCRKPPGLGAIKLSTTAALQLGVQRLRGNGLRQEEVTSGCARGGLGWILGNIFFSRRVVGHWHSLSREWWSQLSLEVFQIRGDVALRDVVSGHGEGGLSWALWSKRSFQTLMILWFYDLVSYPNWIQIISCSEHSTAWELDRFDVKLTVFNKVSLVWNTSWISGGETADNSGYISMITFINICNRIYSLDSNKLGCQTKKPQHLHTESHYVADFSWCYFYYPTRAEKIIDSFFFCKIRLIFRTCTLEVVCLFLCLLSAKALANMEICGNTDHSSIFYLLKISFVL